jgi:SPP1 family predicted phage head-tail adaptor
MLSKKTFDDQVQLIAVTITQDEYANEVETEEPTTVWADIKSVGRSEFYNALQNGLKPSVVITVKAFEYTGQKYLMFDGKRFKIERTYTLDREDIELTCTEVVV